VNLRPLAVFVDLGNVLVRFDHMTTCQRLARNPGRSPEEVYQRLFGSGLERNFDLGLASEEEFAQQSLAALGNPPISPEELLSAWSEIFTRDEANIASLAPLRSQATLVLISNTNSAHYREARRMVPELGLFHHQILSFEEHCRKPDPEIFRICLERAGFEPHQAVLVDDGREHVESARRLGFQALLHEPGTWMGSGLRDFGWEIPDPTD
jgi:FMN phosphatase YigB (HAD superfamily)